MKRSICLLVLPLALGLSACSGTSNTTETTTKTTAAAPNSGTIAPASPTASSSTAAAAPTDPSQQVGPSRTAGAPVINAEQGEVKITSCKSGSGGVEIKADIKNSTKEQRTYIVTAMVYDEKKKVAGSAALMADDIAAGQTKEATGKSNGEVKGKITCDVAQIDSMPKG